jgi:hypothetical protein
MTSALSFKALNLSFANYRTYCLGLPLWPATCFCLNSATCYPAVV